MGASGAGKTSLLNVLSGEVSPTAEITGKLYLNSTPVTPKDIKKVSGFVFQDDVILATMTVREAVMMAAKLRLPDDVPLEVKTKKVDDLLALLRLNKAADTIIGDTTMKGISGGERKRTALAMELVSDPQLLFLDEVTSGLDSFSAFNVCDILKKLAKTQNRTVISTIHQPSSEIFHMFDDLCLLSEGRVIYFGPIEQAVEYFGHIGYKCPMYTNPADFLFMDVLNTAAGDAVKDLSEQAENDRQRIRSLIDSWEKSSESQQLLAQVKDFHKEGKEVERTLIEDSKKYRADFATQFRFLLERAAKNAIRNKFIIRVKFMQSIFIALLIGLIYLDINRLALAEQVQNRAGIAFFVCTNMVMGSSIGVLSIFAAEKAVFAREYANGYYGLPAYFITKTVVELPHQIIFPFLQTCIMYWMIGLSMIYWYSFLVFAIIVILLANCGNALGIFFASIFSNLQVALAVTPLVLLPLMIFSGLFVNNGSIPVYFDWIKYLSCIVRKYLHELLSRCSFICRSMACGIFP